MGNSMATSAVSYGANRTANGAIEKADGQLDAWSTEKQEQPQDVLENAVGKIVDSAHDLMAMEKARSREVKRNKVVSKNRKQAEDIRAKYGIKR
mmetsp:Transcript_13142/g.52453  ORF Transcript_13142/g.52453 Transcript_13142/m.52453 type:complete len:94 (+) Transcript_13142:106-387(+)